MNQDANIFEELSLYLTTLHPNLNLGNDNLKNIKYTKQLKTNKRRPPVFTVSPKEKKNKKDLPSSINKNSNDPLKSFLMIESSSSISEYEKVIEIPYIDNIFTESESVTLSYQIDLLNDLNFGNYPNGKKKCLEANMKEKKNSCKKNEEKNIEEKKKAEKKKKIIHATKYVQTQIKLPMTETIPIKRQRESICPCCEWKFPYSYTEDEKNRHVNICIDGNGINDIEEYKQTVEAISHSKKNETDDEKELEEIEEELKQKCPHCNLGIGGRSEEFRERHIKECFDDAQERNIGIKDVYSDLESIPKKTVDSFNYRYNQSKRYFS